jgi:LPXTG-site transpeptidase (sortase) family protein
MRSKAEIIYTLLSYFNFASYKYSLGYISSRYLRPLIGYCLLITSIGYLGAISLGNYTSDTVKPLQSYAVAAKPISTFENTDSSNSAEIGPKPVIYIKKLDIPTLADLKPVNKDFSVVIPRLDLNVQVVDGVDPFSSKDYSSKLNKGIAHAKNTVYPGQIGNIFLFAHSATIEDAPKLTNDFFYNLGDVEQNEEVFTVYKGQVRRYAVKKKVIIKPTETEYLTNKYDSETLTLMTCWPAGDNSGRLIVIAEPVE